MDNIIIFGSGDVGLKAKKKLEKQNKNILFFVDNDKEKWGKIKDGLEIYNPDYILDCKYDYIAIGIYKAVDIIYKQLISMGVEEEKIIIPIRPDRIFKCNIKFNYENEHDKIKSILKKNNKTGLSFRKYIEQLTSREEKIKHIMQYVSYKKQASIIISFEKNINLIKELLNKNFCILAEVQFKITNREYISELLDNIGIEVQGYSMRKEIENDELLKVFVVESLYECSDELFYKKINEIMNCNNIFFTKNVNHTLYIASSIFSENSMRFLSERVYGYSDLEFLAKLDELKNVMEVNCIPLDRVCVVSGGILQAYGLRKSKLFDDIDIIMTKELRELYGKGLVIISEYVEMHKQNKYILSDDEIIMNNENYFIYKGIKFMKLELLYNSCTDNTEKVLIEKYFKEKKSIIL